MKNYEYTININCKIGDYLYSHNIDFEKLPPTDKLIDFGINILNPNNLTLYDGKIEDGVFKINVENTTDKEIELVIKLLGVYDS